MLCLKVKHLLIKSINYNRNNTEIFLANSTQEEHILQRKENNKKLRPDILERDLQKKKSSKNEMDKTSSLVS